MADVRWTRWLIAAFFVALLVLGGAVAVAVTGDGDKSTAEHAESRAAAQLRRQRAETTEAETRLETGRTRIGSVVVALATPLATANALGDLIQRQSESEHVVQDAGLTASDDYNAAVDQANAIVDQFNAAADRLDQQIAALKAPASQRV